MLALRLPDPHRVHACDGRPRPVEDVRCLPRQPAVQLGPGLVGAAAAQARSDRLAGHRDVVRVGEGQHGVHQQPQRANLRSRRDAAAAAAASAAAVAAGPPLVHDGAAVWVGEEALHLELEREVEDRHLAVLVREHRRRLRRRLGGVDDADGHLLELGGVLSDQARLRHAVRHHAAADVRPDERRPSRVRAAAPKEARHRPVAGEDRPVKELRVRGLAGQVRVALQLDGESGPQPRRDRILVRVVRPRARLLALDGSPGGRGRGERADEDLLQRGLRGEVAEPVDVAVEIQEVDVLERDGLLRRLEEVLDHAWLVEGEGKLQRRGVRLAPATLARRLPLLLQDPLEDVGPVPTHRQQDGTLAARAHPVRVELVHAGPRVIARVAERVAERVRVAPRGGGLAAVAAPRLGRPSQQGWLGREVVGGGGEPELGDCLEQRGGHVAARRGAGEVALLEPEERDELAAAVVVELRELEELIGHPVVGEGGEVLCEARHRLPVPSVPRDAVPRDAAVPRDCACGAARVGNHNDGGRGASRLEDGLHGARPAVDHEDHPRDALALHVEVLQPRAQLDLCSPRAAPRQPAVD
mmetsp:Transcript_24701/g.74777  ORF Transcript_24701/g.74777 Transcript_24701/m.74777 type:complete len:584 (-) Transcript_24701:677-2428(-)